MDRNEAKAQMRKELETEIDLVERDHKVFPIGDRTLSANDLMAEVESDTDLGKFLLDDFIDFKSGKISKLTPVERAHAIAMMNDDLKIAHPGWADKVIFSDTNGKSWTPNQIMVEVNAGTDFGNQYVVEYLTRHSMLESLLGKGYDRPGDGDAFSLPGLNEPSNDKAN